MKNIEIPEIVHLLTLQIKDLIIAIGLNGREECNDFVAYNPTRQDNHLGSFRICIRGAKQGTWKEFSGNDVGGDALQLIDYCLFGNANKAEAIKWAKSFLKIDTGISAVKLKKIKQDAEARKIAVAKEDAEKRANNIKFAQRIFFSADQNIKGTPVENYLQNRKIDFADLGRIPAVLRYAPKCWYSANEPECPAMVAAVYSPENQFCAIHRTYLKLDNGIYVKKDKKVLGEFASGAIRIWRGDTKASISKLVSGSVPQTENSSTLILTEGIEDALSVAVACPEFRIWAAISVGNMKNIKIPKCIDTVIIAADNDAPDSPAYHAVETAAEELQRQGCLVKIARSLVGKDFNDQLKLD